MSRDAAYLADDSRPMILVDTSVWISHLRKSDIRLVAALEREEVLTHPLVIGELACGNLGRRHEVLRLFSHLPRVRGANDAEVLEFIERRRLMGRGIGIVDVHLLAAVTLSGSARLWTRDARLAAVAVVLGVGYRPAS